MQQGYEYRLYLDDLPSATIITSPTGESKIDYQHGIPIGKYDRETKELMIYNHLEMTVKTHWESGSDKQRIVGFEVEPRSIANKASRLYDPDNAQDKMIL